MTGYRIRLALGAALSLAVLTGCAGDGDAAAEPVAVAPSVEEEEVVVEEIAAEHEAGGEADAFGVAEGDVRLEKPCGQLEADDGIASDLAYVLVTNSAPMARHFHITVNTYDRSGVRGEPMYAYVYSVAPGETARARGSTGEFEIPGLTCELGTVRAIPAEGVPDGDWWWLDEAS